MPARSSAKRASRSRPPTYRDEVEAEVFRRGQRLWHFLPGPGKTADDLARLRGAELLLCRSDFFHWADNWAWIDDPKAVDPELRSVPLQMWPKQRELAGFLLDGYRRGRDRDVNKSREIGATWIACALLYWLFAGEEGFSALMLTAKEKLVDNHTPKSLFGKLRYLHEHQPAFLRPRVRDITLQLENLDTKSVIVGESTASTSGRSTRFGVVLTDEWAHVDRHKQQPIRLGLESVARSWWRVSTPNGKGDDFHASWMTVPEEDKLEIGWKANPQRTAAWYEGLLRENGGRLSWDEREQEYGCSFTGVSGLRIFKADRAAIVYEDNALPEGARRNWSLVVPMDFGSGPSLTVALFMLVTWDLDKDPRPHVYVDRELVWQRRGAGEIGADIVAARRGYADLAWFIGDPAGRAAESNQESWESNLQAAGVPIQCLPAEFNDAAMIDETLRDVQRMLDMGRLHIHAKRCPVLLEALESWEWDLPRGIPLELVSRALLKPKKDVWSHSGDALRYGIGAVVRIPRVKAQETEKVVEELPKSAGGEVVSLWDRLLGISDRGPEED